jgi:hypothetical protein
MARTRAGAARRGSLVVVSLPASEPSPAERELARLLARLSELEAETAGISESLARFRDEKRARLAAAEAELHAAKRLEERLVRLIREAEEWAAGPAPSEPKKRRRPTCSLPPLPAPSPSETDAAPWLSSKELYRTLVRKLHPDFAATDAERARRSELMARVNAAYAREDRVLLELLHEEADSDAGAAEPSSERRAGHAERRLSTIAPMVASLEKGLARLRASSSFKELEAARRAAERGSDFFGEAAYAARKAARESSRNALMYAERLDETLRVYRARSVAPPARTGARRARRDAWPGERLLRDAVAQSGAEPIDDESRRVAARLEALAAGQKWQVVLSLFALFGEASAEPPPALATFADVRATYELLCSAYPSAPAFDRALVDLPPHLEVGMRAYSRRLVFGVQVKRPEQLAGLRMALDSAAVEPLARAVLAAMGPVERCDGCGESRVLVHLFRVRGIDEVHALACPACGALRRSYRTFGGPAGIEALAPFAVALGLVVEQPLVIGASIVALELLPREARRLDVKSLVDRVASILLDEISPELRGYVQLTANRRALAPSARIEPGKRLRLVLRKGAPLSTKELERQLLARARSRFRVRSQSGRSGRS